MAQLTTLTRVAQLHHAASEPLERPGLTPHSDVNPRLLNALLDEAHNLERDGQLGPAVALLSGLLIERLSPRTRGGDAPQEAQPLHEELARLARDARQTEAQQQMLKRLSKLQQDAATGQWSQLDPDDVRDVLDYVTALFEEERE